MIFLSIDSIIIRKVISKNPLLFIYNIVSFILQNHQNPKNQQTSLAQIETTSFLLFAKRYSGKLEIAPKKINQNTETSFANPSCSFL